MGEWRYSELERDEISALPKAKELPGLSRQKVGWFQTQSRYTGDEEILLSAKHKFRN
jgi:hypothetical protein